MLPNGAYFLICTKKENTDRGGHIRNNSLVIKVQFSNENNLSQTQR